MERNDSHQERVPVTPGKNDLEVAWDNCAQVVVVIDEYPWPGLQYFPCVSTPSLVVNKYPRETASEEGLFMLASGFRGVSPSSSGESGREGPSFGG